MAPVPAGEPAAPGYNLHEKNPPCTFCSCACPCIVMLFTVGMREIRQCPGERSSRSRFHPQGPCRQQGQTCRASRFGGSAQFLGDLVPSLPGGGSLPGQAGQKDDRSAIQAACGGCRCGRRRGRRRFFPASRDPAAGPDRPLRRRRPALWCQGRTRNLHHRPAGGRQKKGGGTDRLGQPVHGLLP